MNIEKAEKIVSDCAAHIWYQQGICDEAPPGISGYGLQEIIDANAMVEARNKSRDDGRTQLIFADRLIAALYALAHFPAINEAVVINQAKALVVIDLPEDFFEEGD